MFKKQKRRIEDAEGYTENIIAGGTRIQGTISGSDTIRIAGRFEGDVNSEGLLIVTKEGLVQGTIRCLDLIVEGAVEGQIEKARNVEVRETGKVNGNIICDRIALAEGSFIEGEIHMNTDGTQPSTYVEKRET